MRAETTVPNSGTLSKTSAVSTALHSMRLRPYANDIHLDSAVRKGMRSGLTTADKIWESDISGMAEGGKCCYKESALLKEGGHQT